MFTGIIETTAALRSTAQKDDITTLTLERPRDWELMQGQSIAVNGACLTVVSCEKNAFTVELTKETLERTSFGIKLPEHLNLERAMPAAGRFEGHIVQGHIDTTGSVAALERSGEAATLSISYDTAGRALLVRKGSVAIDGVSLTLSDVSDDTFSVALIPHTLAVTALGSLEKDAIVNLEFDIIGKYISRYLDTHNE